MNKPLNVFILNTPHDNWENHLIKSFKNKNIINNAIVQKAAGESKKLFLRMGSKGLEGEYEYVPQDVYAHVYSHLFEFMDMYSRVNLTNSGNYNELNVHQLLDHFNLILNYYYRLFTENDIDLFIHNNSPHVGYDFIPNILAERLGIKTLYLEQSIFPNRFYYYWKYKDYGTFSTSEKVFKLPRPIKLVQKFEKDIPYMKSVRRERLDFSRIRNIKDLDSELDKNWLAYRLLKEVIRSNSRGQALSRYRLRRQYDKYRKGFSHNIDLDSPFVYFGLHLQPEKSTSSWGGIYADQALALEHLSAILPSKWKIYVKENPKQTYFMRNPEFFRRLERIPNLELVSPAYNTYDLIKNAKLCATITGTIGWESITGGKPVIVFGWGVWYRTLPGVINFSPDLDLEKISTMNVNFSELESEFYKLTEKLAPGIILNEYYPSIYEDYNEEKNNETVTKSIEAIINSELK